MTIKERLEDALALLQRFESLEGGMTGVPKSFSDDVKQVLAGKPIE